MYPDPHLRRLSFEYPGSAGAGPRQVRTGHGTMDWFKIGKGVRQVGILSLCLFNFYAEFMQNSRQDESQVGIKIAREITTTSDMQIIRP